MIIDEQKQIIDDFLRFTIVEKSYNSKFLKFVFFKIGDKLFKNNSFLLKKRKGLLKEFQESIENLKMS